MERYIVISNHTVEDCHMAVGYKAKVVKLTSLKPQPTDEDAVHKTNP